MKNTYEYQVIRALERKLYLIDLRGGRCEKCGYNKNLSAFDFHHVNPKNKKYQLCSRKLSNSTMESILKEFKKCKIVCANCHREEHTPNYNLIEIRKRIHEFKNSLKKIKKPIRRCMECGVEIHYRHKRCRKCKCLNSRKKGRPHKDVLIEEFKKYGLTWCTRKYKVSNKTIYIWRHAL